MEAEVCVYTDYCEPRPGHQRCVGPVAQVLRFTELALLNTNTRLFLASQRAMVVVDWP